jgi:hypothetical protein
VGTSNREDEMSEWETESQGGTTEGLDDELGEGGSEDEDGGESGGTEEED